MRGRVLVIAGSDSGGGAGIQADVKSVMAMGGFAGTAVTALTAQNTVGVHGVYPVSAAFVRQQMVVVLSDIGADAVKTGMLGSREVIEAVRSELGERGLPLVVDPVMVAKGGARLLDGEAVGALWGLLALATVATPNVPEAEVLLGRSIASQDQAVAATEALRERGVSAVLLKGGHFEGAVVRDVLATAEGITLFERQRIESRHTHGTGCTLASAIAAGLAQGMGLVAAVERARSYVQAAIIAAPGFGEGHGPLDHGVLRRVEPGF